MERKKLLIADDSEMNRAILANMLEQDFEIMEVSDGKEALAALQIYRKDLSALLLDIVMPEMDGFQVLEEMKQRQWLEDVPTVMISAETGSGYIDRAFELGAVDYINRPFSATVVRQRIINTILLHTRRQEMMDILTSRVYRQEKSSEVMLSILNFAVEYRNGEGGGHMSGVEYLTGLLLRRLMAVTAQYSLTPEDVNLICTASGLHDIGKLLVPEDILQKPGKLTDEEFAIIKTHTKLGYDRFLARYGGLEGITPVWPESDLEMIDISVPQYIDQQPFSIYYMTVSGHCGYSLKGNAMSRKNYDRVDYDGSEAVKCYLASQLELEKAMESLIRQLEEAGIADDTVIVISPDHYPYALERSTTWGNAENYLTELYGVTEMDRFTRESNALIIWSGCLEDKNLKVETPVYSLDILPTLSNLFGLDYDSRLLVGRDVFSDTEPLVLWPEYSWKTDKGTYEAESRTFTPAEGADVEDGYVDRINAIVSNKINYSREVQNMKYFQVLSDYLNGK